MFVDKQKIVRYFEWRNDGKYLIYACLMYKAYDRVCFDYCRLCINHHPFLKDEDMSRTVPFHINDREIGHILKHYFAIKPLWVQQYTSKQEWSLHKQGLDAKQKRFEIFHVYPKL